MLDCLAALHAQFLHKVFNRVCRKNPEQIVFHRQVKARISRIALTPCTATQLIVDASGLMTLRANNMQAAGGEYLIVSLLPCCLHFLNFFGGGIFKILYFDLPISTEHNVRSSPSHVGCNSDNTWTTRLRNNLRLAFVKLRVQNLVSDFTFSEKFRDSFGRFD